MLRSIALLFVVAFALAAQSAAADMRYTLKAEIEPSAGTVAVTGTIAVPVAEDASQVSFALHRTFEISRLAIAGKHAAFAYKAIEPTPFNPATRDVVVTLPRGAARNGAVTMGITYAGKLAELPEWGAAPQGTLSMDDQVNARLVQLASYSSWYPQFGAFGRRFGVDLTVSMPKGWVAVSSGAKTMLSSANGREVTQWQSSNNFDIVISAAPNFRRVVEPAGDAAIEVYYTDMPDAVIAREAKDLGAVMGLYERRFGKTVVSGGTVRHVYAPMQRGQGRAGIARLGLIVTSEGRVKEAMANDPGYTLFQDIAHEIGHFWWNFGTGQGDWINESFAEYSSALAVRDIVSQDKFDAVIAGYRKTVAGLPADAPSLATVPADGSGFFVRYYKGSLMLDDFRRTLGDAAFFAAAHEFFEIYKSKGAVTADFLSFWKAHLGTDAAKVDDWVDSTGGLPQEGAARR